MKPYEAYIKPDKGIGFWVQVMARNIMEARRQLEAQYTDCKVSFLRPA